MQLQKAFKLPLELFDTGGQANAAGPYIAEPYSQLFFFSHVQVTRNMPPSGCQLTFCDCTITECFFPFDGSLKQYNLECSQIICRNICLKEFLSFSKNPR